MAFTFLASSRKQWWSWIQWQRIWLLRCSGWNHDSSAISGRNWLGERTPLLVLLWAVWTILGLGAFFQFGKWIFWWPVHRVRHGQLLAQTVDLHHQMASSCQRSFPMLPTWRFVRCVWRMFLVFPSTVISNLFWQQRHCWSYHWFREGAWIVFLLHLWWGTGGWALLLHQNTNLSLMLWLACIIFVLVPSFTTPPTIFSNDCGHFNISEEELKELTICTEAKKILEDPSFCPDNFHRKNSQTRSRVGKSPWVFRLSLCLVDFTAMVFRHVLLAASFFGSYGNELGQQILASSTLKFAFFGKR